MKTQFSIWIKRLRLERGLNQKQAAKGVGIDQSSISVLETGKVMPYPGTCKKFADFYGVPVEELLKARKIPAEAIDIAPTQIVTVTPESLKLAKRVDLISECERYALMENIDALISVCERREFQAKK